MNDKIMTLLYLCFVIIVGGCSVTAYYVADSSLRVQQVYEANHQYKELCK